MQPIADHRAGDPDSSTPSDSEPVGSPAQVGPIDLAELDALAQRPLPEHAEVYGQLHARLQAALSEIDDT